MRRSNFFIKLLSIALFLVLVCYIGYTVYDGYTNEFRTSAVFEVTIEDTMPVSGFVARDEYVISGNGGNTAVLIREGEKVSNGQSVAANYSDSEHLLIRDELSSLEARKLRIEQLQDGSALSSAENSVLQLRYAVSCGDIVSADDIISELEAVLFEKYDGMTREELSEELTAIESEIASLTAQLNSGASYIYASAGGTFSHVTDGYESISSADMTNLSVTKYNELFGGDPMWITESVGGMGEDGRTLVTKNSYRMLNTLYTLGSSPEPNLTVLWSNKLPESFKRFCAKVSCDTDSIQYENDDVMRPIYGDDYAIACCVSAMKIGKQMQFFGARCNLAKLLLLSLNGGYDTSSGINAGPQMKPFEDDVLSYDKVYERFTEYAAWLLRLYVNTMNVIHYMHDKYAYEKAQMALHDTDVHRFMAFGIAGLSVITDSLSAIKYARVTPVRDENGYITDFKTDGDFPKFGNDDDRVDMIAKDLTHLVITELRKTPTYRNAEHTLSVLTITSNVMYGKHTGATPDGRKAGAPFAPGANPMHNREENGALASLNSVAKLSYDDCRDGISNTFSITPETLGRTGDERVKNLVSVLDGYFAKKAHHINVNVLNRQTLIEAYNDPTAYPNLTIRVSGYAVNFHKLSREQQREVISRTFHEAM